MRRRQIYALQKQNLAKHYIGGPIVIADPHQETAELNAHLLPPGSHVEVGPTLTVTATEMTVTYPRRGWCPKCDKYIE